MTHYNYKDAEEENFTDGSGRVSTEVCNIIRSQLNNRFASSFQIRLGGAKGTLVEDVDLKGMTVNLRKSMVKFENSSKTINIIRAGTPSPGYLNR